MLQLKLNNKGRKKMKTKLGFLGAGKMAEGILAAAALEKGYDPKSVLMAEIVSARAKELTKKHHVRTTPDVKDVAKEAPLIFLSVKPQDVETVAKEIKPLLTKKQIVVSIVAGKSLATLRKFLGPNARLIRVMPNLALRAKEGMCALCPAKNATAADVKKVAKILNGAGKTIVLKEKAFDAVTAVSGSGPAFFAFMEQAMMEGGMKLGLKEDEARLLAEQTMLGTAAYLRQSGADLETFINGVATKGGTTAAGMDVLRASNFKNIVADTLAAAANRSAELGK
jgi:pyrroline-5-carboxylate reductase